MPIKIAIASNSGKTTLFNADGLNRLWELAGVTVERRKAS